MCLSVALLRLIYGLSRSFDTERHTHVLYIYTYNNYFIFGQGIFDISPLMRAIHIRACTCMCMYMYVHVHTRKCTYTYMYMYMYIHVHVHVCTCTCTALGHFVSKICNMIGTHGTDRRRLMTCTCTYMYTCTRMHVQSRN